jgi:mitochondrial import receptor subunit TOM20
MESTASSIRPTTVALISVGTILTGFLAYAAYFDHRRRTDPAFRKSLKKENRQLEKARKEAAETVTRNQKNQIKALVEKMNAEGYPETDQARENFFLEQLSVGEQLQNCKMAGLSWRCVLIWVATDPDEIVTAAAAFFKALKVYHKKSELISIIDSQVKKVCSSHYLCLRS